MPRFDLLFEDEAKCRRLEVFEASSGPQLCREVASQLGGSGEVSLEYYDIDFSSWVNIDPELRSMPPRAKVRLAHHADSRRHGDVRPRVCFLFLNCLERTNS